MDLLARFERQPGAARLAVAIPAALAVFVIDMGTSAAMVAAVAYIPLTTLFFGVTQRNLIIAFSAFCGILNAIGATRQIDQDDLLAMVTTRILTALVLCLMAGLVYRIGVLSRSLRAQATQDPLTGARNRRSFFALGRLLHHEAARYRTPYSVLMIDIDHFKRINDGHGHQVGDDIIRTLAHTCAAMIRPSDVLARYGGEEFVVVLPQTDVSHATSLAERIRVAVSQLVVDAGSQTVSFTISAGAAVFEDDGALESVIARADAALYAAKRAGRNRVCIEHAARAPSAELVDQHATG